MEADLSDVLASTGTEIVQASIEWITNRIERDPTNQNHRFRLGELLRQKGDLTAALAAFRELQHALSPDDTLRADVSSRIALLEQRGSPMVTPDETPALFRLVDDVLDGDQRSALWELIAQKRSAFAAAPLAGGLIETSWRSAKVVGESDLGDFGTCFSELAEQLAKDCLEHVGLADFEFASVELHLSAHADGDFYKVHQDRSRAHGAFSSRRLTFVYYLFELPQRFTGGDLLLFDANRQAQTASGTRYTRIIPRSNTMILFDSETFHQVVPVRTTNGDPEPRRFTLNGWIHEPASSEARPT